MPCKKPLRQYLLSCEGRGNKIFDSLVWQSWHEDGNIPKAAKKWLEARVNEFKAGTDIDLVCNCRRFRGQDDAVGL